MDSAFDGMYAGNHLPDNHKAVSAAAERGSEEEGSKWPGAVEGPEKLVMDLIFHWRFPDNVRSTVNFSLGR